MQYHIRHIALPAPGSVQQFDETVSFLNASLLDRGHPLWECYIIDGIENGRIAVLLKVHHSLIDGEGGLRVMRNFLSDSPRTKTLAGPWMAFDSADKPRRSRPNVSQIQRLQGMLRGLTKLPGDVIGVGNDVVDLGAQLLNLKPRRASLPFTARRTLFNNTAKSAARAYANIELPLADVKAVAKATDTSVNDVIMTTIDDALHHYLGEHQVPTDKPLVAFMPMSLRDESGGGGNQVSAELIPMGAPEASPIERLKQINTATTSAKDKGRGMQTTSRQAYALLLASSLTMSDTLPWFGKVPSANLVISNMKGPTGQLYLAGAPMVAFTGLPILPPGAGLNVTFASVNTDICLAIGAAPEAVHEPFRLAELIERAFRALQIDAGTASPTTAGRRPSLRDQNVNHTTPKSRTP
jgi:WS/DGAT/MGAT family acyltransferase